MSSKKAAEFEVRVRWWVFPVMQFIRKFGLMFPQGKPSGKIRSAGIGINGNPSMELTLHNNTEVEMENPREPEKTALCRINLKSDPISLKIIAADGTTHQILEAIGDDGLIKITLEK